MYMDILFIVTILVLPCMWEIFLYIINKQAQNKNRPVKKSSKAVIQPTTNFVKIQSNKYEQMVVIQSQIVGNDQQIHRGPLKFDAMESSVPSYQSCCHCHCHLGKQLQSGVLSHKANKQISTSIDGVEVEDAVEVEDETNICSMLRQSQLNEQSTVFLGDSKFLDVENIAYIRGILMQAHNIPEADSDRITSKFLQINGNTSHIDLICTPSILFVFNLTNNKVIGAYSKISFSSNNKGQSQQTQVKHESMEQLSLNTDINNIAFICDVTNFKCFYPRNTQNTKKQFDICSEYENIKNENKPLINFGNGRFIWGNNEVMFNIHESHILHTNFCRQNNLYWDESYTIQEFIGSNKQYVSLKNYEIYSIHFR